MLTTLFTNLRERAIASRNLEFAEEVVPTEAIAFLRTSEKKAVFLSFQELLVFEDTVNFAAKKEKKCTKGYSCGKSCISPSKNCRNPLEGQAKNYAAFLKLQNKITPDSVKLPAKKEALITADNVDKSNYKALISLGESFANNTIKSLEPSEQEKEAAQKLDLLKQRFDELDDAYDKKQKITVDGTPKKVTTKMIDSARKEYWNQNEILIELERDRKRSQAQQFADLKNDIIKHHNVNDDTLNKVVNQLRYRIDNDFTVSSIKEHTKELMALTGLKGASSVNEILQQKDRAWASRDGEIDVSTQYKKSILFHELGHHIEFESPEILKAVTDWRNSRAESLSPELLIDIVPGSNYSPNEVALRDKYITPYTGKVYNSGDTEVVSTGIERFSAPIEMHEFYKQDKEHFHLILGIMLARKNGNNS